ncbi:hypothetical protein [Streptomyces sp. TRM75563]|uniref:hypothetical protein n=1 Tax=Streptomyces sp. TRM75563 TaxID=2817418 RepID=UPI001F610BC8|nr:hypothetical protein [Streptomyces sp. TRM75563]MCI4041653.1 hypothetical protein [Streptomyces sp. TRM75563]
MVFLAQVQADQARGGWIAPTVGEMLFSEDATHWTDERDAAATNEERHWRLPRRHLEPAFGEQHVNAISPAKVRTWRAERARRRVPPRRRSPVGY